MHAQVDTCPRPTERTGSGLEGVDRVYRTPSARIWRYRSVHHPIPRSLTPSEVRTQERSVRNTQWEFNSFCSCAFAIKVVWNGCRPSSRPVAPLHAEKYPRRLPDICFWGGRQSSGEESRACACGYPDDAHAALGLPARGCIQWSGRDSWTARNECKHLPPLLKIKRWTW